MLSNHPTSRLAATATLAFVLAVTGCSRGDSIESTSDTSAPSSTSESSLPATIPATSAATTPTSSPETTPTTTATTVPDTTTTAETTTTAATTTSTAPITAADLTLAADGVRPFEFGDSDATVVAGLTAALGAPTFDRPQTYANTTADGLLVDASGDESYIYPIGRTVCFGNDLCAQFGGTAAESLGFTGWHLDSDAAPQISTAQGITVGSRWSDHLDDMFVGEGGCYTTGYGDTQGMRLALLSVGEPFATFDEDGTYVTFTPDPADVTVLTMTAGEVTYFLYEDC
jgi:hypothetical protein